MQPLYSRALAVIHCVLLLDLTCHCPGDYVIKSPAPFFPLLLGDGQKAILTDRMSKDAHLNSRGKKGVVNCGIYRGRLWTDTMEKGLEKGN